MGPPSCDAAKESLLGYCVVVVVVVVLLPEAVVVNGGNLVMEW